MSTALRWLPRLEPREPAAVAATGGALKALGANTAERLLAGSDLRVIQNGSWLVVLAAGADLPWADGATYLGWEAGLLLPTTLDPSIPAGLLQRTLNRPRDEIVVVLPGAVLHGDPPTGRADPGAITG